MNISNFCSNCLPVMVPDCSRSLQTCPILCDVLAIVGSCSYSLRMAFLKSDCPFRATRRRDLRFVTLPFEQRYRRSRTGRLNEIQTLRWEDVDLEAAELGLSDSKTEARMVPLSGATVNLLSSLHRS